MGAWDTFLDDNEAEMYSGNKTSVLRDVIAHRAGVPLLIRSGEDPSLPLRLSNVWQAKCLESCIFFTIKPFLNQWEVA